MLKERGIIMSGDNVRAILAGRKTQFRVEIASLCGFRSGIGPVTEFGPSDTPGYDWHFRDKHMRWHDLRQTRLFGCAPLGNAGDRLWVKETWCYRNDGNGPMDSYWYRATNPDVVAFDDDGGLRFRKNGEEASPWQSGINMPRKASRIDLEIIDLRVEQLQAIAEADAVAEGVRCHVCGGQVDGTSENDCGCFHSRQMAIPSFEFEWSVKHDKPAEFGSSWRDNPRVWVYEFRRIKP